MAKERDFSGVLKKLKKRRYWVAIAVVIILLIVGVSLFGEKLFQKEFWQDVISKIGLSNHKSKQPQCTADTTLSCSNGDTIVTQECNDGFLVNTETICPCTANTTLACDDGSTIITQQCTEGVLINTGKICPCIKNTTITCSNGDVIVTQECVKEILIGTGKVCPCTTDITATCYDGSTVITQNCVNGTLRSTGKACPPRPIPIPIDLNAQRLQTLFQKSSYFTKLPSNAAILLTFFDGNGKMRSEKLFISSGGKVGSYAGGNYDLEFTMGDYRIPELESSSDFCATLAKIKSQQDLRVSLKNVLSIGKYVYLKSCVPF
jgi:uncharacterized protein YlzI (FlbEa/FlbD family)